MTITDAQRVKRELFMRSMFPSMPLAAHVRLVELLEEVDVAEGQILFAEGDPPDHFLFLVEGRVLMERAGQKPWEFSGLSVVGVVDAVLERPRLRSCRALEPTRALVIRSADWFDMLEDNAQIARAAVRNFATQLHARWQQHAQRLPQASEPPPASTSSASFGDYDKILALRQAGFLRRAGMQAVATLATVAEVMMLRAGDALFESGTAQGYFYVVGHGLVEITGSNDFRFMHDAGDVVGGAAAFCSALVEYAARAHSDSIVLRIHEQEFYDQAEEHPRLTRGILAFLVTELEELQTVSPTPLVIEPTSKATSGV